MGLLYHLPADVHDAEIFQAHASPAVAQRRAVKGLARRRTLPSGPSSTPSLPVSVPSAHVPSPLSGSAGTASPSRGIVRRRTLPEAVVRAGQSAVPSQPRTHGPALGDEGRPLQHFHSKQAAVRPAPEGSAPLEGERSREPQQKQEPWFDTFGNLREALPQPPPSPEPKPAKPDSSGVAVVRRKMSLADWRGSASIEDDSAKPLVPQGCRARSNSRLRSITSAEAETKDLDAATFFAQVQRANTRRRTREDVESLLQDARHRRESLRSESMPAIVREREPSRAPAETVPQESAHASSPPQPRGVPGMPPGWSTAPPVEESARPPRPRGVPGMPPGWDAAPPTLTRVVATATAVDKAKIGFGVRVGAGNLMERLRANRHQTVD